MKRKESFYIRPDKIAMISLGPLSKDKYCTYNCAYCYVQSQNYPSYEALGRAEIINWLKSKNQSSYDIIYVSGDTDSFAQPRTKIALELLENLIDLNKDILFSTKFVFTKEDLEYLSKICNKINSRGHKLFGCVTVAQLNQPELEPKPIPKATERIKQLKKFKELGLVSVLAIRPFMPIVPIAEYKKIIDLAREDVDLVLGEVWYCDQEGEIERKVFGKLKFTDFKEHLMDFDDNGKTWKVYEAKEIQAEIEIYCKKLSNPFYMRSKPAVEYIRNKV